MEQRSTPEGQEMPVPQGFLQIVTYVTNMAGARFCAAGWLILGR